MSQFWGIRWIYCMTVTVFHCHLLSPHSFLHGAQGLVLSAHLQQTAGPVLHQLVTSHYQGLQLQLGLHREMPAQMKQLEILTCRHFDGRVFKHRQHNSSFFSFFLSG